MSTIVELSAEQALTPTDEHGFDQEETRTSLSPLAQGIFIWSFWIKVLFYKILGTLSSVLSTFVAISKMTATTTVNFQQKDRKQLPLSQEENLIPEEMK